MAELALVARWALAAVLLVSAVAKLADRARTADAVVDLGVPQRLRWAAPVVPAAELVAACLLVVPATGRWGAVGALALLAVFTVAIAANLVRGRRPACNCFGRIDDRPIGGRTLVRNAFLLAVAAVATQREAASPADLVPGITMPMALALGAGAVALAAFAALTWLVTELWRQQARLLDRIDALEAGRPTATAHDHRTHDAGPPVGGPAPDPRGRDTEGEAVALSQHWVAGRDTLVVFGDPHCPACNKLHPDLAAWRDVDRDRHVVVVSRTEHTPLPAGAELFVEEDRAASIAFRVTGTPSALLVAGDGTVSSPLAEGYEAVRALLADPDPRGADAPAPVRFVTRPAAAGRQLPEVDLPLGADADTVMLFWNEGCGHCRGMVDALRERSTSSRSDRPQLTIVVPTPDQAHAVAERMPAAATFVDPEMRVNLALGVPGTPSAALVGPDRRLVADLAIGPDAVLALFDRPARTRS